MPKFRWKYFFASLVLSVLMAFGWIIIGSFPYSLLDEVGWYGVAENFFRGESKEKNYCDDAYFVNVGFDKQVADVQVAPFEIGHSVVTDRKVLLDFLTIAERADYKYIFLDIRFEKGYDTASDSALFAKIAGMRDIVCAYHYEKLTDEQGHQVNGFEIADSALLPKCAYNDYHTSALSSGFTRYAYLQAHGPSVALRMYQDIDGKTIKRWGWFYLNDGALCEKCPYIPIREGITHIPIREGIAPVSDTLTTVQYRNLGPFLMTLPEQQLIDDMKGKIVVVGDFDEDVHDTYMSMKPGPYLTYLAYKYLARGGNNISYPWLVFMALVFFAFIWYILSFSSFVSRAKNLLVRIFLTLIFSSLFFTLISIVVFLFSGHAFNVGIPLLVISLVSIVKELSGKTAVK